VRIIAPITMARPGSNPPSVGTTLTVQQPAGEEHAADAADRGYLLLIEDGSSAVQPLPPQGTLVLGRAPDVEIPLRSLAVSRRHARLEVGNEGVHVEDLGSHNGTRRNGELLPKGRPQPLHAGDVLTLCDVAVVYYGPKRPAPQRALWDAAAFRQQLAAELDRASQSLRQVALLVVRGPQLATLASTLIESALAGVLRRMDLAAIGSRDELWLLLPETDEEEAAAAAARILAALRPLGTASAGFSATAVDGYDVDALLGGARAAAELAPAAEVRSAGEAVSTLQVGEQTVLLADPAMVRLYTLVERLAASDLPVLVCGETGTGKELVAQTLHERSPRRSGRLVSINCAALPENLAESELFGHERGAFTGATASKPGLLEVASGGTVFLDELGELSPAVQAKLLRVLETRRLVRVGDTRERAIDVRLVAATHRKLQEEAAAGRFRQDLYFRLSTAVLVLPPLRDRKRELPLLARTFLSAACAELGKPAMSLSAAALERLSRYGWPGNVRELKNAMRFAAATAAEPVLKPWHLPEQIAGPAPVLPAALSGPVSQSLSELAQSALQLQIQDKLAAVEMALVSAALKLSLGNKSQAARLLGVHRKVVERLAGKEKGSSG